jgi:hypothetical protein
VGVFVDTNQERHLRTVVIVTILPPPQPLLSAFVYHYIKSEDGWVNATTQLQVNRQGGRFPGSHTYKVHPHIRTSHDPPPPPTTITTQGSFIDQNSFFGADVALNEAGNLLVVSAPAFRPAGTGEGSCE